MRPGAGLCSLGLGFGSSSLQAAHWESRSCSQQHATGLGGLGVMGWGTGSAVTGMWVPLSSIAKGSTWVLPQVLGSCLPPCSFPFVTFPYRKPGPFILPLWLGDLEANPEHKKSNNLGTCQQPFVVHPGLLPRSTSQEALPTLTPLQGPYQLHP